MANFTPTVKGKHVRVWLAPNGLSPAACPTLEGCMIAGEVSFNQNVTVTRKKCPSTIERGRFDTVYTVVQRDDPEITTSLENRLPADMRSLFLKLNNANCRFDMVWAYGVCSDPNDYNEFDRIEAFLDVIVTSYDHDQTGAFDEETLTDDVLETIEVEALEYFDYVKPTQRLADTPAAGTVYDVVIADTRNCADTVECEETTKSDGTQKVFALVGDGTDLFIRYSEDGGVTWSTSPAVTTIGDPLTRPTSLTWVGRYLVISAQSSVVGDVDYVYALRDDVLAGTATWVAVNDAAVGAIGVGFNLREAGTAYFAGAAGSLRYITSSTITASSAVTGSPVGANAFNAINGYDASSIYAVGDSDTIVRISNGVATAVTATGGGNDITAVAALSRSKVVVGDDAGDIYFSANRGSSWQLVASLSARINAIAFANRLIGYALVGDSLFYTADGGCTWTELDSTFTVAAAPTDVTSIQVGDGGNYVLFNSFTEILIAEDDLRLTYGAI